MINFKKNSYLNDLSIKTNKINLNLKTYLDNQVVDSMSKNVDDYLNKTFNNNISNEFKNLNNINEMYKNMFNSENISFSDQNISNNTFLNSFEFDSNDFNYLMADIDKLQNNVENYFDKMIIKKNDFNSMLDSIENFEKFFDNCIDSFDRYCENSKNIISDINKIADNWGFQINSIISKSLEDIHVRRKSVINCIEKIDNKLQKIHQEVIQSIDLQKVQTYKFLNFGDFSINLPYYLSNPKLGIIACLAASGSLFLWHKYNLNLLSCSLDFVRSNLFSHVKKLLNFSNENVSDKVAPIFYNSIKSNPFSVSNLNSFFYSTSAYFVYRSLKFLKR